MDLAWTELSPQELEQQYSPSSCLPNGDYLPFVLAYRERSDEVKRELAGQAQTQLAFVRYGEGNAHTIDLAIPAGPKLPPIVVFIHGGYWQELSKFDSFFPAAACVAQGWAFAALDYTLAPEATIDEIVAECSAAINKLAEVSGVLGYDSTRIVLCGSSAGAHLAAMVAMGPAATVAGTVLISGVFDLAPLVDTTINDAVGLDPVSANRNSPLHRPVNGFPSTVLVCGSVETDQFKAQTNAFAMHLELAETRVAKLEVAGRNHFDVVFDLAEQATAFGDAVASLVDSTTSPD